MSVGYARTEKERVVSRSTSLAKRDGGGESETGWTIALTVAGLFGLVALSKRASRKGKGRRK